MTATEIITISISIIAFVVSIVSIALQYSVRDDLRFKVTDVRFVSLEPIGANPRTAAIAFSFSVYNLGNRPVALEHLSLGVITGNYADLEKSPPTSCEGSIGQILVPISRSTYDQLGVPHSVIQKEGIFSDELVFDLFYFERVTENSAVEGLLCLSARFSNSKGKVKKVLLPVGIVGVSRQLPDTLHINFSTEGFQQLENLNKVF